MPDSPAQPCNMFDLEDGFSVDRSGKIQSEREQRRRGVEETSREAFLGIEYALIPGHAILGAQFTCFA
jgi:hypothetical protein